MGFISYPHDFDNGETADGEQVMDMFTAITAQVNGAIDSTNIAADAVGNSELGPDAVNSTNIADDAVGTEHIQTNAVGSAEIAAGAVGASEIATDAVGTDEIAPNAVGASEIQDGSVGAAEIAAGAVGASELSPLLTTFADTQTANLNDGDGVLTGISITPGAGTYLAIAEASFTPDDSDDDARINIRVNGVDVVTGVLSFPRIANATTPLYAFGFITPAAAQAVEVFGDINNLGTISSGRLLLLRIG